MTPPGLDFVIIGAQKSASTYVHRVLEGHPHIDIPSEESRNFEDPYYGRPAGAGGVDDLGRLFGPRAPGVRRGIKRPDHLADPDVPARLAAYAPNLRMIVVLRDPVPRAVSAYFHYVRLGFLPLLPVRDAFEQILDASLERTFPRAADVLGYGRYGEHLGRYLAHFDRDQLHVLFQPDLRIDPTGRIRDLLTFLDVDASLATTLVESTRDANASTYAPWRLRVQRSRNRFMFDYTQDRYRRSPRPMSTPGYLIAGMATILDERVLARLDRRAAPRLDHALEQRVRDYYSDDEARLRELVGPPPWAAEREA